MCDSGCISGSQSNPLAGLQSRSWLDHLRDAAEAVDLGSLGRYRVLREAGRGGQGVVYQAVQAGTDRVVAIKRLRASGSSTADSPWDLKREAMIAASLSHPGLTTILGVDYEDGNLLVIMEWIDGLPIDQYAKRNILTSDSIVRLLIGICDSIQHAHSKGVLHGDLKPSNILIDNEGKPHIVDFGIASQLRRQADHGDMYAGAGTIPYAAPERYDSGSYTPDVRTDVYSLGVLLDRLLSSRRRSKATSVGCDASITTLGQDQVLLNGRNRYLSRELEAIVAKSIDESPEDRYANVEAFKNDLNRWLDRMPVTAFSTSRTYVVWKQLNRYRFTAAISLGAIVGLIALSVLSTIFGIRARQQQLISQAAEQRAIEQTTIARDVEEFASIAFSAAAPELLGRKASIEDAVDYARSQLDSVDDPMVRARLEYVFGDVLFELGRYDDALNHFERSVASNTQYPRHDKETYLAAQSSLAVIIGKNGDPRQASKILTSVAKEATSTFGRDHPLTLEIRGNLAAALMSGGDLEQAFTRASESLVDSLETLGPDHNVTLVLSNTLATVVAKQGDLERAQELYQQCYERRSEHLGRTHPTTLVALNNLATAYASAGYLDRAEPLYKDAFDLRSEILGEEHPATLRAMRHYADLIGKRGRTEEAIQILERCVERSSYALGLDHPDTLTSQNLLGLSLFHDERFHEAIDVHKLCLAAREQTLGDDNPETQTSRSNLAIALSRIGEYERAIELMELAYAHRIRDIGPDHPITLSLMANLAMTYSGAGEFGRAEELLAGVLASRIELFGSDHPRTAVAVVQMGSMLRKQGRHSDAVEYLQTAFPILRKHQGITARSTLICAERLAISLETIGRQLEALDLAEQLIADFESAKTADRSRIANIVQIRDRLLAASQ